jgi:hypothetical protein
LHSDVEEFAKAEFGGTERLAIDEFAYKVVIADIIDGDDVGVIERGDGAGFLLEALSARRVGGEIGRKDFQCDFACESSVARAVDFSHAAGAERGKDFVRAEAGSGVEWHGLGSVALAAEIY